MVCACDDGDVYSYYTSAIVDAIERRKQPDSEETNVADEIHPFLLTNLDSGAWGIAVHKQARLIAISTNAHSVNVLAFALCNDQSIANKSTPGKSSILRKRDTNNSDWSPSLWTAIPNTVKHHSSRPTLPHFFGTLDSPPFGSSSEPTNEDEQVWPMYSQGPSATDECEAFRDRDQNVRVVLDLHENNIPCLAFCNTDDNRSGRFLVSSDIEGCTIIWDVQKAESLRVIQSEEVCQSWGLHWIDQRSFRRSDPVKAVGPSSIYHSGRFTARNTSVQRSIVEQTPDSRHAWPWNEANLPVTGDGGLSRGMFEVENASSAEEDLFDDETEENDSIYSSSASSPHTDLTSTNTSNTTSLAASASVSPPSATAMPVTPPNWAATCTTLRQNTSRSVHQRSSTHNTANTNDAKFINQENYDWPPDCPSPDEVLVRLRSPSSTPCPSHPLLLISKQSLTLFQTPHFEHLPPSHPAIHTSNPLHQPVPPAWSAALTQLDRMNMNLQIPELGLIIAGSPKGRVAILSLHQCWPNPFVSGTDAMTMGKGWPVFTQRVDVVLPTKEQEERGERPSMPLVGVAAGPILGVDDDGKGAVERRWRLMLLYQDETVMSYELWRDSHTDNAGGGGSGRGGSRVDHRSLNDVPLV